MDIKLWESISEPGAVSDAADRAFGLHTRALGSIDGGIIPRMPLYEYHCEPCDHSFETLIRSSGDLARCPHCGSVEVAKLLSVPAVAHTGHGRASELPICGDQGGRPSFGCGRPQCGPGMCAGLDE